MKAGLAAALFAVEGIRRAGIELNGTVEVSGTVDEESGGFAGVAWLAEQGRLSAARTDYVIIPEPLCVDRICIGHRGVYWFEVLTRGRIAHGSMPFLGSSAIDHMGLVLDRIQRELHPRLASRTTAVPVIPPGARHADPQRQRDRRRPAGAAGFRHPAWLTPAARCSIGASSWRKVSTSTKSEIVEMLEALTAEMPEFRYELKDLMVVHPVCTPEGSPVVAALERALYRVLGRSGVLVASPGTYDQKHIARIAGVPHCVAYGPGILDLAHQPDEYCSVEDLTNATKVIALAVMELTGTA